MTIINPDSTISLHYRLALEDGTEIENNYQQEPLVCIIGDGTLCAGMEDALIDACINDEIECKITPEQGYGYPDADNIHSVPLSDFEDNMEIAVGHVIAFDGIDDDEEIAGTIMKIKGSEVIVDFSHPLAGRHLIFKATVVAIENSSQHNDQDR